MADVIEKIIKIEASGSENTVRGLKKEIDSLRDALLNVEKGGDEYKKILEQLIGDQKQLADVMSAGKNEASAAEGSYNALRNEMSALKKVWAEVTDEVSRNEIGKRIDEINTELKEMDASIGNFQRNVGNYASGFKNARQELAALKTQMDNLEEGSAEYVAAFQRAAEITHTLQERQEMLRYSSADLKTQMSNVVGIATGLMGGFNALQGVMALTGKKSEELEKTMMKLQAGIAIVQGLQGLQGMGDKMRGLVDGLTNMIFKTNQATTAVQAETAAQEANIVATEGATLATKGFQKALVATGIGAIVVLIGSLVAHWDEFKDMVGLSNEKLEEFQGIMDKVIAVIVGVANAIGNILITPIKNAITYISTLGTVIKDVFTLNFSQIGDHIKEGFSKIVDNVKKGYDVVGNYQEAYNNKSAQLSEKRMQAAMKASAEELNEIIKDNEAKEGSDWKYTEEGKKMYDQYFEKKLAGYKKDSKEYKEALREKWAYDREYQEHLKQASKAQSKQEKEVTDEHLKEAETIAKRADEAIKDEEQKLKEKYEYEKALLIEYHKDTTALEEEYQKNLNKIKEKAEADKEKAIREKTRDVLKMSDRRLRTAGDENEQAVQTIQLEYSLKEAKSSGSLSFNDLIEETNRIYEANKQHLETQAAEYKALMENADIDEEARINAKRDYENTLMELDNLATQNTIDNLNLQREAVEAQIEIYSNLANSIADIFGSIADIMENDIKTKIKNGEITEEEGEKQFKAVKSFQIAQATIQMLAGITAALAGAFTTKTGPWDMVLAGTQAATIAASGIAQIAKIKSTQLGGSGGASSSVAATPVQTAPEEYVAPYTQNATGESEVVRLADSIKNQRVIVVEADITEAQEKAKRVKVESTW